MKSQQVSRQIYDWLELSSPVDLPSSDHVLQSTVPGWHHSQYPLGSPAIHKSPDALLLLAAWRCIRHTSPEFRPVRQQSDRQVPDLLSVHRPHFLLTSRIDNLRVVVLEGHKDC